MIIESRQRYRHAKKSMVFLLVLFISAFVGCFRWKTDFTPRASSLPLSDAEALYNAATSPADEVINAEKLEQTIHAFERVPEADPEQYKR